VLLAGSPVSHSGVIRGVPQGPTLGRLVAPFIVHITTRSAWELARSSGRYDPPSLAVEGFIHFSDVEQVVAVANAAFSGQDDLVLLCVAVDRLEAPLRYESSDAGGESFPHVYGALNLDAVLAVMPLVEDDGFAVPAEVRSLRP
jgi:uncharacterized protein (DUF952 family)